MLKVREEVQCYQGMAKILQPQVPAGGVACEVRKDKALRGLSVAIGIKRLKRLRASNPLIKRFSDLKVICKIDPSHKTGKLKPTTRRKNPRRVGCLYDLSHPVGVWYKLWVYLPNPNRRPLTRMEKRLISAIERILFGKNSVKKSDKVEAQNVKK